jgi:phosphorylated adapter RNA export protein
MQMEKQPPPPLPAVAADEVERTIAEQLGESKPELLQLLHKVVKKLGPEQALAFLKETQEIEAQGGLLLPDGSRRRTPGGVFFYLVRTKEPQPVPFLFWKQKAKRT